MNRITFTTPKGEALIAEFDRDICASMEERKITPDQVFSMPAARLFLFFHWAFKKNQPKVSKAVTDAIWEAIDKNDKPRVLETLGQFWEDARDTLMDGPDDDSKKVKWEIG